MPVVRLFYEELEKLSGVTKEKITKRLSMIGGDIERVEEEYMDVEFFPNRPDLFSVEGVSRALKGFLDIKPGLIRDDVEKSDIEMVVAASVLEVRPYIVCGVIKDLKLDSRAILSLMELQEHLHQGIGRNREKVSIGVHDLSKVKPPFRYLAVDPHFSFVPLDYEEEMTMEEILERHKKGVDFRYILKGKEKYPLILDCKGNTLSFPPIINAELTRVSESTKDIFIDVTGTNENVSIALNIISCALAERGGRIQSVLIKDEKRGEEKETPCLTPKTMEVSTKDICSLIGVDLSAEECRKCAERMGLGAKIKDGGGLIEVKIPAYRYDILHPWDIIEDIAIGYGYDNIQPEIPHTLVIGEVHPVEEKKRLIREIMTGLGYFEVLTFTLTSEKRQFELMRRRGRSGGEEKEKERIVKVASPISAEHTMLRCSILPNLLEILSLNKHRDLPQRIFEVGSVVLDFKEKNRLAAVSIHVNANFAEVKSLVDVLIKEMGMEMKGVKIVESEDSAFLEGRRADILRNGKKIGVFGEIHPEVILNFELDHPIVGLELDQDI